MPKCHCPLIFILDNDLAKQGFDGFILRSLIVNSFFLLGLCRLIAVRFHHDSWFVFGSHCYSFHGSTPIKANGTAGARPATSAASGPRCSMRHTSASVSVCVSITAPTRSARPTAGYARQPNTWVPPSPRPTARPRARRRREIRPGTPGAGPVTELGRENRRRRAASLEREAACQATDRLPGD